jgi:hypothetical protein
LFQRFPKAKRRAAIENDWAWRRVKDSRFESLDLVLKSVGRLLTERAACPKENNPKKAPGRASEQESSL